MFYQNSIGMPERVQEWGCYATVAAAATAAISRKEISQAQYLYVVEEAEKQRVLTEDPGEPGTYMYVMDPEKLFYLFGIDVMLRGKENPDYQCLPDEIELLLWRRFNGEKNIYHFTFGDGRGKTVYDPWAPFSLTAREGELRSKRIFRIKQW
jgi:hypothetical protein